MVSSSKKIGRWNPFSRKNKKKSVATKTGGREVLDRDDVYLSPTTVESSTLSLSPDLLGNGVQEEPWAITNQSVTKPACLPPLEVFDEATNTRNEEDDVVGVTSSASGNRSDDTAPIDVSSKDEQCEEAALSKCEYEESEQPDRDTKKSGYDDETTPAGESSKDSCDDERDTISDSSDHNPSRCSSLYSVPGAITFRPSAIPRRSSCPPKKQGVKDVSCYGYEDVIDSPTPRVDNDQFISPTPGGAAFCPPTILPDSRVVRKKQGVKDVCCYGYEDATPDAAPSQFGYSEEASCNDDNTKCSYGNAKPAGFVESSSNSSDRRTSRRSSMKQSGRPRRASIQLCGEVENVLPSSNGKTVTRRTSITFNDSVKVKKVAPVKTLTPNPEALWFQDDEFDRMKQKCFDIVEKVDQGLTGGKKYCTRGLERLSHTKREQVLGLKYEAWDAVLDEQDYQRESGQFDDGLMADAYKSSTLQNQMEAEERAREDAADVENYLRNTRRLCRRLSM